MLNKYLPSSLKAVSSSGRSSEVGSASGEKNRKRMVSGSGEKDIFESSGDETDNIE
jgi:hypothetical protein